MFGCSIICRKLHQDVREVILLPRVPQTFSRPFHGLNLVFPSFPAVNCWAIVRSSATAD